MKPIARFQQECEAFFEALGSAEQKPLIFGDGQSENPVLMLIGEAPGEHETLQGKPFVGKAGKNLEAFLQTLHLKRGDIYISNVVKIRPTKVSAAGRVVNRPPSREEKALFTPWLMREIAVVQPGALVTLGNVALQVFLKQSIGAVHGQWNRAVIAPPEQAAFTLPLFALYHPASIIYNPALSTVYQDDLGTLGKSLGAQSNADDDI